jgi:hypothetical protein
MGGTPLGRAQRFKLRKGTTMDFGKRAYLQCKAKGCPRAAFADKNSEIEIRDGKEQIKLTCKSAYRHTAWYETSELRIDF